VLRWQVGDVRITRVVELVATGFTRFLLPQATPEAIAPIDWLAPHFVAPDGRLIMSIHALLLESQGQRIIVDTCLGNDKERRLRDWNRRSGPFLKDLVEAGAPRESIDLVACTHLHVDHVGWNTMLVDGHWAPTFPNARYLFGRVEWEYWKDQPEDFGPVVSDSVRPIVDAGLADLVEMDHVLTDEVRLEPTPGHTPGHVAVRIRSGGEEAVITGDLMHHPCQIARPDWAAAVDYDPDRSGETRHAFLEGCADRPVLVIGTHFAGPTAGRIVRDGDAYRLDF
jgi:glyoxylase-like metal-dependent hydrolase (beta-lactamase superfamily II)